MTGLDEGEPVDSSLGHGSTSLMTLVDRGGGANGAVWGDPNITLGQGEDAGRRCGGDGVEKRALRARWVVMGMGEAGM